MAITTFDGFIGSTRQFVSVAKLASRTTVAAGTFTVFDLAGNPGPGTLAGTSTGAGVVPTDATDGFPLLDAFTGGATGYLAQVDFGNTVGSRMRLFDLVFKAGAYGFAGGTSNLTGQPSYAARMPGGLYDGTQIWIEVSTAFATGNAWTVTVNYQNQANSASTTASIGNLAAAGLTIGRMYQLPLAAGDTGVQRINSVTVTNATTAMTAGAFNVLVMRPLWSGRVKAANDGDVHDLGRTGMPQVFADSAIYMTVAADGTSSGLPELEYVIASG